MDKANAVRLLKGWAGNVGGDLSGLVAGEGGCVIGRVGSVIVKYEKDIGVLIVWSVISVFAYRYIGKPEYFEEILNISRSRADLVGNAVVDIAKFPGDVYGATDDGEPWLVLRKEFFQEDLSIDDFITEVDEMIVLSGKPWRIAEREALKRVNQKYGLPDKSKLHGTVEVTVQADCRKGLQH